VIFRRCLLESVLKRLPHHTIVHFQFRYRKIPYTEKDFGKFEKERYGIYKAFKFLERALIKDVYDISREYRDELRAVSPFIAKTSAVADIFGTQKRIVDLYSRSITRYDKNLDEKMRKIFRNTMKGGVASSLNYLKDLDVVISPNFSKMTDAERLKLIGDIKAKMDKEHEGMDAVNTYLHEVLQPRGDREGNL